MRVEQKLIRGQRIKQLHAESEPVRRANLLVIVQVFVEHLVFEVQRASEQLGFVESAIHEQLYKRLTHRDGLC